MYILCHISSKLVCAVEFQIVIWLIRDLFNSVAVHIAWIQHNWFSGRTCKQFWIFDFCLKSANKSHYWICNNLQSNLLIEINDDDCLCINIRSSKDGVFLELIDCKLIEICWKTDQSLKSFGIKIVGSKTRALIHATTASNVGLFFVVVLKKSFKIQLFCCWMYSFNDHQIFDMKVDIPTKDQYDQHSL